MIWKVGIWDLVMLTLATLLSLTLPFWNPSPMTLGEKVFWWVIFGGAMIFLWVIVVRGRVKNN